MYLSLLMSIPQCTFHTCSHRLLLLSHVLTFSSFPFSFSPHDAADNDAAIEKQEVLVTRHVEVLGCAPLAMCTTPALLPSFLQLLTHPSRDSPRDIALFVPPPHAFTPLT